MGQIGVPRLLERLALVRVLEGFAHRQKVVRFGGIFIIKCGKKALAAFDLFDRFKRLGFKIGKTAQGSENFHRRMGVVGFQELLRLDIERIGIRHQRFVLGKLF